MTTIEATAAVLKYSRERAGLSQYAISKRMRTSRTLIRGWENAETLPKLQSLLLWAWAVDVPAWKLLREIERRGNTVRVSVQSSTYVLNAVSNRTTLAM